MGTDIEYWCADPEHHHDVGERLPQITADGHWGFCPAGDRIAHLWLPTGGMDLAEVTRLLGRDTFVRAPARGARLH
jgi:hypothetical protein